MCSPESRTIPSTASKSFCPGTSHSRRPTPRTTRTNTTDIVSTTPDRGHDQPRPPDSRQHGELRTLTNKLAESSEILRKRRESEQLAAQGRAQRSQYMSNIYKESGLPSVHPRFNTPFIPLR